VQSIKVISDNQESGIEHLNAVKLTELVSQNINDIKTYIDALLLIVPDVFKINFDIERVLLLRGTHSQRLQVRNLVQKLQVMNKLDIISDKLFSCNNLKGVLVILRDELNLAIPSVSFKEADLNG